MGDPFRLTDAPTRVTASTTNQDPKEARDVIAYEGFELFLQVYELGGTGSPSLTVKVETSMQNAVDASSHWHVLATFTAVTTANKIEVKSITSGVLRYLRWTADLAGTGPSATFEVTGIARPG